MTVLQLLEELIARKGSDLHLSSDRPPAYRVHGRLVADGVVLGANQLLREVLALVPENQRGRFEADKELDFSCSLANGQRFRGNLYLERGLPAAAFRALNSEAPQLERLGLPATIAELIDQPRGLFLVTGQTGSGKSTTLAACMNRINQTRQEHLITIEDPIEYLFRDERCIVHQRELGQDTNSFARALRASLREDPDVIMVGEMRDLETIQLAISAAETGHLVLSTVHTRSAATTVDRLVDVFPAERQAQVRVQLSNSLLGICSQTLCRTRDGSGRVLAAEVLRNVPAAANLIREGKSAQLYSVLQAGAQQGMQTLEQDLARLVQQGTISLDEALSRSSRPEELSNLVGTPMPSPTISRPAPPPPSTLSFNPLAGGLTF